MQKEPIEGVEQVMEHTQKQDQEGITTPLSKNYVLQVSAKVEGHTSHKLKCM